MPKWNLDALGHEEFERMCQSLAQQIIGPGVKVYGMGKDGAREATFHGKAPYPSEEEQWGGDWIVQAKFHDCQVLGQKEARQSLFGELDNELAKVTEQYQHPCDNYILMTNVVLTPVFQRGLKDRIDDEIIPKYDQKIKNINILGADEICRFLDTHVGIRQTYGNMIVAGDIMARLLKVVDREDSDLEQLVRLYCSGCYTHEASAALDDAGDDEDKPVPLPEIFIDLDVKPASFDLQQKQRLPHWLIQATEDESRTSALSYLLDDSVKGLVLIGGPGEGKSTLGQYIAQIHRARITGNLSAFGEDAEDVDKCLFRVPFRIILRHYAQWLSTQSNFESLFHYLSDEVSRESGQDAKTDDIQDIFKDSPTLLILDGLDEVPERSLRSKVLTNLHSFVNQVRDVLQGDLRVVATTRPQGYSEDFDPNTYLHLTLQSLPVRQACLYARRWTSARESNPSEAERILATLDACCEDPVVGALTKTPLQVTILLVIIRARGTPPKQVEELFERYVDVIYVREQKKRPELLRTDQHIIYGLHKFLGYTLHKRAESDRTAALMSEAEFEIAVSKYIRHSNPLLTQPELSDRVDEIIKESRQRLVLIESPQAGQVGFSLTTTREFFAAAHMVDTAKDTKERDLRFRAIARAPYWRNVALFFAGRVGRTRPGEAPSMVDICREIDTEDHDRFLRRGSTLVLAMLNDRALRETHNAIGAIQFSLTILDADQIVDINRVAEQLKDLPDEYKERVVRPWLEDRLQAVNSIKLRNYVEVYERLFESSEVLSDALRRASQQNDRALKMWALSHAIKNEFLEQWSAELLEYCANQYSTEEVVDSLRVVWKGLDKFVDISLSQKASTAIAYSYFSGGFHYLLTHDLEAKDLVQSSSFGPQAADNEQTLLHRAILQLLNVTHLGLEASSHYGETIRINFPLIVQPDFRALVGEAQEDRKQFVNSFSGNSDPFIQHLVLVFESLADPLDVDKLVEVALHNSGDSSETDRMLVSLCSFLLDIPSFGAERLRKFFDGANLALTYYHSHAQYRQDIEELQTLVNQQSSVVASHPEKFALWISAGYDTSFLAALDQALVKEFEDWFLHRGLSAHGLCCTNNKTSQTLEVFDSYLDLLGNGIELSDNYQYDWGDPKTPHEEAVSKKLVGLVDQWMADDSSLRGWREDHLANLNRSALRAGLIDENYLLRLYDFIYRTEIDFPPRFYPMDLEANTLESLYKLVYNQDLRIARLAAVLLAMVLDRRISRGNDTDSKAPAEVGFSLWQLSKDQSDKLRLRLILCMEHCQLEWSKLSEEMLAGVKETDSRESVTAWRSVISGAAYRDDEDRQSLLRFLVAIQSSPETYRHEIRHAALVRLGQLVSNIEPIEIDEPSLNLPLTSNW